jgi:hypothetical protein
MDGLAREPRPTPTQSREQHARCRSVINRGTVCQRSDTVRLRQGGNGSVGTGLLGLRIVTSTDEASARTPPLSVRLM